MSNVLIAYASTFGQTKKIVGRVAEWLKGAGFEVEELNLCRDSGPMELTAFDAFVIAGSVHRAKHHRELEAFVKENAAELRQKPGLFLSVSLSAAGKETRQLADAQRCIDEFVARTGWKPTRSHPVAGALEYSKYNFLVRHMMRRIAQQEGGDTDLRRDYEYTDWPALESFVDQFVLENLLGENSEVR